MEDMFFIQAQDELFGKDWLSCYATNILDAKYEWADVAEVIDKQTDLNAHQKKDLIQVLQDNSKMFGGTLVLYPHHKVHIELVPVRSNENEIISLNLEYLSQDKKVNGPLLPSSSQRRMVEYDGSLSITSICFQSYRIFWANALGISYFTKLDVSIQYYMFELDEESQDLCTIIMSFGKDKYA
eukprot:CCRYP_002068-RA/>CCRYP_002068-RA protein AED:0.41 eAED:0.41 QI:0/0/0/1/0/0/3/0/182